MFYVSGSQIIITILSLLRVLDVIGNCLPIFIATRLVVIDQSVSGFILLYLCTSRIVSFKEWISCKVEFQISTLITINYCFHMGSYTLYVINCKGCIFGYEMWWGSNMGMLSRNNYSQIGNSIKSCVSITVAFPLSTNYVQSNSQQCPQRTSSCRARTLLLKPNWNHSVPQQIHIYDNVW